MRLSLAHRCALGLLTSFVLLACSSGSPGPASGAQDGDAASAGEPLDLSDVTQVTVAQGYCGGAPGKCYGQRSFVVTFGTSTLERSACVEGDAGSDVTTRLLSAQDIQRIREALAGVRVSSDPHNALDGQMSVLTVTTAAGGAKDYSPEASCNHGRFTKIVAGWKELSATVFAL
jgi:hypothetical protein